jgi:hypothetical protein
VRVLVDGHNAMYALGVSGNNHEARRMALLRRVSAVAPEAVVYFDARNASPDQGFDRTREAGMRVKYCRTREADAAILEAVKEDSQPGRIIVVTRDREVAGRCAQLGARPISPTDFLAQTEEPDVAEPTRKFPTMRFTPADFGLPDYVDLDDPDPDLKD